MFNATITLFGKKSLTCGCYSLRMGKVIMFPLRAEPPVDEIDLFTAVDVAIRDLREIAEHSCDAIARDRAAECQQMLESAYEKALVAS